MFRLAVGTLGVLGGLVVALGLWRGATDAPAPVGSDEAVEVRTAEVRELDTAGPTVTGTVEAGAVLPIVAPRRGAVAAIEVEPDDRVAAGDVVVRFEQNAETASVMSAEAELAQAEAEYAWASEQAEAESVAATAPVTDRRLDELRDQVERARAQLETSRADLAGQNVEAPIAGRVEGIAVEVGELVTGGDRLVELRNEELAVVRFKIPREFTATLATGDRVDVVTADSTLEARVISLEGAVAGLDRDIEIVAEPAADSGVLEPGAEVRVRLPGDDVTWLTVPRAAVLGNGAGERVFRIDRGLAWSLPVERAPETEREETGDEARVAVRGAIQPGEQVAVGDLARLTDGTPVTVVDDGER